jgi:DNA-binding FrmR family transcriptional regulator
LKKEIPITEVHVRQPVREKAVRRLKSIEGQVRGLQRMLEEDRYCIEILTQIASAQEALRATSKLILRNYLETCATNNIVSGDQNKKEKTYDELMEMMYKYIR